MNQVLNSFVSIFISIFSLYIVFVGIMYVFQRKLLYLPSKTSPSLDNFKGVYVEVGSQTQDNLTLTHWYSKQNAPYIMIFQGNAGNIENRAYKFNFLVEKGYSVFLISYRGYGGQPGHPTESDLIADSAQALEQWIQKEKISLKNVFLLGESLGSGVAVALAAQYPVGGVILDGAYSSVADVGQSVYPYLPVKWLVKDRWDSLSRIKKVKSPILFIHSKRDPVLPFRLAQKLFQAANKPKQHVWLEPAGHDDNLSTESVRKSIFDFLHSFSQP